MSESKATRRSLKLSAPRFIQPLSIREEDDVRTLECRVDGYPRPDIRWEKFGRVVGKCRRIHMTRSGDKCLLQIKMPLAEDHGLYTCIATNIEGMATTQTKISTPYLSARKINGTCPRPSSNRSNGIRSQTLERSLVEKSSESNAICRINRNMFRMRSQSGNSKTRQDNLSLPSKSTFTSHILNNSSDQISSDSDYRNKNVENIISSDKKRLCKSMEDCRKTKRSILNRVKIPDIFNSPPKSDSKTNFRVGVLHPSQKINGANSEKDTARPNGNHSAQNDILNKETTLNGDDSKIKAEIEASAPLSTRERIAAYLKRFETSSPKSKYSMQEKVHKRQFSSKKKTDENKDSNNPNSTESDSNFFSFAKFRRRKSSSSSSKKNSLDQTFNSQSSIEEVNDINEITPLEHSEVTPAVRTSSTTNGDVIEHNSGTKDSIEDKCFKNSEVECVTNGNTESVSLNTCPSEIDLNSLTFEQIDVNILEELDPFNKKDSGTEEIRLDEEDKIEETHSTLNGTTHMMREIDVPTIRIQLSSEDNEEDNKWRKGTEEITIANDDLSSCCDVGIESDSFTVNKSCQEKISHSDRLIEEECDSLSNNGDIEQAEILETELLQRVSSPVQSPARIVKGPQSVTILRGESVTLAISFTGTPSPQVIWMKGGRVLKSNERLSILEGREMSVVTVNDVTADDSGKYVVSVENDGGGDSCFASVAVVGFPEPPGGEPTASEVTDHSLVLSWYGSMYDGGSVVTGYQVDMCTLPDKTWYKVATSVNTSCTVQGLSKGQRYLFRVKAENRYGLSHPSKDSKVICVDDFLQETSSDEEQSEDISTVITVDNGNEFSERFDLKEEVGKGRFGTVYRCVEKSCGRPRAAKIIRCLKVKDKEKVRQEIEIMSRLQHPKLMQVLAAFESGRNMIMVMEFISGGELFERVIADDFVLTEQDCILFMRQICDGVAYMHRNDVLHLDLKPENILCKTRTSHKIKIIDFGLARFYNAEENLRVLFGTPEFVAPEVINYEPVCPSSDMWSVGVICYVLISGLSPFMGDSDTETFANITRGEMDFDDEAFDDVSDDAKDFISNLLVKKLRGRMSAEECLKHRWLATSSEVQKRPLSTEKLKRFIIRRKWQKSGTAIRALGRMVSLSRSSISSSIDSPVGSPMSSRSGSSLISRSETAESGESDIFQDLAR